jgi:hypothetical protein
MDWLVSRESPAVRFVTLRDLLQRPPKDIELRKARQGLSADPYLRDALPLLRRALQQGPLDTRYGGGLWQTLFLLDLGCDASQPELARAGDALLAWWQLTFVEIERNQDSRIDLGLFSQSLRALVRLGYGEDPRVLAGAELVALNLSLRNSALSEFHPHGGRLRMGSWNALPHLHGERALWTY